jgi:subfamily B ATP-binding cassette protein HlyB/CyaB
MKSDERIPSGLISLAIVLNILKINANIDRIKHEYCCGEFDIDDVAMIKAIRDHDCRSRKITIKKERIAKVPTPFVAKSVDGGYFVVGKVEGDGVLVQVPGKKPEVLNLIEFWNIFSQEAILIKRQNSLMEDGVKFSLSWFLTAIKKYKGILSEVLVASIFVQLFALVTPLVFQVVMDKVLVHSSISTLNVLVFALIVMAVFESITGGLRNYLFAHTASRVDVILGAKLFSHLLSLPISFFTSRPVGQVVARVRELETVRSFLTGNALTAVIDLLFSFIFFAVMFMYSVDLTLIVLASLPVYAAISIFITPRLKARTEEKFQRGAVNQAFLTESITGIEALKAMAVEPGAKKKWNQQLAEYVSSSFRVVKIGNVGSQLISVVGKVVTALLLWQGAKLVMAEELTVGALIAFNMLAGQVSQPILRLSQLWQDFQQFRISLDRLGDLINTPAEVVGKSTKQPDLDTHGIELDGVVFRYKQGKPEVLRDINMSIKSGERIGIVGSSGSGKSTISKLLQRLYVPELGIINIGGVDISGVETSWLRRKIGVVMQDSKLFEMSVRDNIAISDPVMSLDRVVSAAKLAGAHEFISAFPEGYDTPLGENGIGLSGGQKQRIAIARILAMNPSVIIFDEATSALDYESESILQKNMSKIASGRTVITIAHRLSAVRNSDRIFTIEKGRVVEVGSHDELMANSNGRYYRLNKLQENFEVLEAP